MGFMWFLARTLGFFSFPINLRACLAMFCVGFQQSEDEDVTHVVVPVSDAVSKAEMEVCWALSCVSTQVSKGF